MSAATHRHRALFALLSARPVIPTLILVQPTKAVPMPVFIRPAPTALGELYPPAYARAGMSIVSSSAVTIFGSLAPFRLGLSHGPAARLHRRST